MNGEVPLHVIGLTLLGAAMLWFGFALYRRSRGVLTEGTVVGMREDSDEGTSLAPIVQFTANNQQFRIVHAWFSSPPAYRVGQIVQVRYLPSNPGGGHIQLALWTSVFGPFALAAMGGMLCFA